MNSKTDHSAIVHVTFSNVSYDIVTSAIMIGSLAGSCTLMGGDWHFGQLKKRNTQTLETWFLEYLGYIPERRIENTPFPIFDSRTRIYAWVDILSSDEYANFLCWINTCKPQRFFLVRPSNDVTSYATTSVNTLSQLLNDAIEKDPITIDLYIREWNKLFNEDADFRLINPFGKLQSFSSSYFDKYIYDSVTEKWEPSSTIVFRIMDKLNSEHQAFPGDIFFYHQLEKFSNNGSIEKQINLEITKTRIRLART